MHYVIIRKLKTIIFKDTHYKFQRKLSRGLQFLIEYRHKYKLEHKKVALAIYDLNLNPITFDFCPFLFMASKFFEQRCILTFELIIVLNDDDYLEPLKKQRIADILLPIVNMCNRVKSFQILSTNLLRKVDIQKRCIYPEKYSHLFKRQWNYHNYMNDNYFENRNSILEPPARSIEILQSWLKNQGIKEFITITIRNSKQHDISRNSNLSLLGEFAGWILNQCVDVVIIPDSENEEIGGIKSSAVCEIAAYNLYHRVALYKLSMMNIFNNNGPSVIPQIGGMRFIVSGMNNEESEFGKAEIIKRVGLVVGKQPFAKGKQGHFLWGKEDIDSLKSSYLDLMQDKKLK